MRRCGSFLYSALATKRNSRAPYDLGHVGCNFGECSVDDQKVMSIQNLGERLMRILEDNGQISPHRWIMVFANVETNAFHTTFFSGRTNVADVIITSVVHDVRVEAQGENGDGVVVRVASLQCGESVEMRPRACRRGSSSLDSLLQALVNYTGNKLYRTT